MSKFNPTQTQLKSEGEEAVRVVKLAQNEENKILDYSFDKIKPRNRGDYGAYKEKYGPLAITDTDRQDKDRKSGRFKINEMLRGPLSIEDEERRMIEVRVNEQVEKIKQQAEKSGFEEGFRAGEKKAFDSSYQKLREEAQSKLDQLSQILQSFEKAKQQIYSENEDFLIKMVFHIGKLVLMKDLAADKEYVQKLCKLLIEKLGVRENIKIRVSRSDVQTVEQLDQKLKTEFDNLKNLTIEASDQIKLGGCQIETEWNAIDATIENQLRNIYSTLTGSGLSEPPVPETQPEAPAEPKPAQEKTDVDDRS